MKNDLRRPSGLETPNRPDNQQSDDMNNARRNTRKGTGIRNEDDIDLGVDADTDEDVRADIDDDRDLGIA